MKNIESITFLFSIVFLLQIININSLTNQKSKILQLNNIQPAINTDELITYSKAENINCNRNNCNLPYGSCTDDNTCTCTNDYANYNSSKNFYCQYRRKKQLTSFMLEFFLSMGIGHLYCGKIVEGIIKLIIMIIPAVIGLILCFCNTMISKDTSTCVGLITMIVFCTFLCTGLAWQLADVILFGLNKYTDGNGVSLAHW